MVRTLAAAELAHMYVLWDAYMGVLANFHGLSQWAAVQVATGRGRPAVTTAASAKAACAALLGHLQAHNHQWVARHVLAVLPQQVAMQHGGTARACGPAITAQADGWGAAVWACANTAQAASAIFSPGVLPVARGVKSLQHLRAALWASRQQPPALAEPSVHVGQLDQVLADLPARAPDDHPLAGG